MVRRRCIARETIARAYSGQHAFLTKHARVHLATSLWPVGTRRDSLGCARAPLYPMSHGTRPIPCSHGLAEVKPLSVPGSRLPAQRPLPKQDTYLYTIVGSRKPKARHISSAEARLRGSYVIVAARVFSGCSFSTINHAARTARVSRQSLSCYGHVVEPFGAPHVHSTPHLSCRPLARR